MFRQPATFLGECVQCQDGDESRKRLIEYANVHANFHDTLESIDYLGSESYWSVTLMSLCLIDSVVQLCPCSCVSAMSTLSLTVSSSVARTLCHAILRSSYRISNDPGPWPFNLSPSFFFYEETAYSRGCLV